ncbi:hypothetical protein SDC9_193417 [bioreactor metagenome]|uniref:Uncharacterized protein n=1 Tax=bioreactor metagenome TaxID=1076179 RepID=A0A645I506_9ZZZZ
MNGRFSVIRFAVDHVAVAFPSLAFWRSGAQINIHPVFLAVIGGYRLFTGDKEVEIIFILRHFDTLQVISGSSLRIPFCRCYRILVARFGGISYIAINRFHSIPLANGA